MRGLIVLCVGFAAAYWVDQHYFDGQYSRETGSMIQQIETRSGHWAATNNWSRKRLQEMVDIR